MEIFGIKFVGLSAENDCKLMLTLPIKYAGKRHAVGVSEVGKETLKMMEREYYVSAKDMIPRVCYRLTDNRVELALRFLAKEHGSRDIKDSMSREILDRFEVLCAKFRKFERIEIRRAFRVQGLSCLLLNNNKLKFVL